MARISQKETQMCERCEQGNVNVPLQVLMEQDMETPPMHFQGACAAQRTPANLTPPHELPRGASATHTPQVPTPLADEMLPFNAMVCYHECAQTWKLVSARAGWSS